MMPRPRSLARLSGLLLLLLAATSTGLPAAAATAGVLDVAFDDDGIVAMNLSSNLDDLVRDLAIDNAGNIVVAGWWPQFIPGSGINPDVYVGRLTPSGELDTTFSDDGLHRVDVGGSEENLYGVALDPNGAVVVAGVTYDVALRKHVALVMRFTAAGALDDTFGGGDGIVTLYPGGFSAGFFDVEIDSAGRIVAAGSNAQNSGNGWHLVARFEPDGDLDPTFGGGDGIVAAETTGGSETIDEIVIGPEDTVIGAGRTSASGGRAILRSWDADGGASAGFGTSGVAVVDGLTNPTIHGLVRYDNGDLAIAGYASGSGTSQDVVFAKVTSTGAAATFGSSGVLTIDLGGTYDELYHLALQPDGKLVGVGYRIVSGGATTWLVVRVSSTGVRDPSFGTDGVATLDATDGGDHLYAVAVDAAGKIVLGGSSKSPELGEQRSTVARITGEGDPDTTAPTAPVIGTLARFQNRTQVPVTWSATDDTDVGTYDVSWRRAAWNASTFGAWTSWQDDTAAGGATLAAAAGSTYCLRATATDAAGNTSAEGAQRCTSTPLDDRALAGAGWSRGSSGAYFAGTYTTTTRRGVSLARTGVRFRGLALLATRCPGCGRVEVRLGSTLLKTVSLAAATAATKVVVPIASSSSTRVGTVTVRTLDAKRVSIDAIVVAAV